MGVSQGATSGAAVDLRLLDTGADLRDSNVFGLAAVSC